MRFRKPAGPRLAPEAAERQGRIARIAWEQLGGRDGAIEFLNAHDAGLGGQPLAIALASAEGFEAVADAIRVQGARRG